MTRDPEKRKAIRRRYAEKRKIEKYGPAFAGVDLRGRHGNHARGERNGRYSTGRYVGVKRAI